MIFFIISILLLLYLILFLLLEIRRRSNIGKWKAKKVAFFHPFCNDGGGGEKVLWIIIQALLEQCPSNATYQQYATLPILNIYSLQKNQQEIYTRVFQRFNINLQPYAHRINIIHISGKWLLTPKPYLTMVLHILLPMVYCLKCIWKYQPDIFYDTTGFAFNFFLVKLLLPRTICRAYVHYPFISEDMIAKIRQRRVDFNNNARIGGSWWKTQLKLIYYSVILIFYKSLRFFVSQAQANSTWTYNHMEKIWGSRKMSKLVPPCSISGFLKHDKKYSDKRINIISLAQFRPEKNHPLQIKIIKQLVTHKKCTNIHLYICGTTRGPQDQKILSDLQKDVEVLKMEQYITFCPNLKYSNLLQKLKDSQVGIHTMQAEHFGISIVQMLAGGSLVLAHNSAGPKHDIIENQNYLASSELEYIEKLYKIIRMSESQKQQQSNIFRKKMQQFGEQQFKRKYIEIFHK